MSELQSTNRTNQSTSYLYSALSLLNPFRRAVSAPAADSGETISTSTPCQPHTSFNWQTPLKSNRLSPRSQRLASRASFPFAPAPDVYAVPFVIGDEVMIMPYVPRPLPPAPVRSSNRPLATPSIIPTQPDDDSDDEGEEVYYEPPSPPVKSLMSLYSSHCLDLGRQWISWLKPDSLSSRFNRQFYAKLIHTPTSFQHSIIKDITRTFPQHVLFTHSKVRHMLFNVLIAYSNYDQAVGYSQGMAFIAGFLLIHVPDEQRAFWMFSHLMFDAKYALRSLYTEDCASLRASLQLCQSLLDSDTELTPLSQHLKAQGIEVTVFVTQWLVTVYSYRFSEPFTQAVWTQFIERGHVVLFQVCMALCHHLQPILTAMQFEQIIPYVTNMQDTPIEVVGVSQHIQFSDDILARIEAVKWSDKRLRVIKL